MLAWVVYLPAKNSLELEVPCYRNVNSIECDVTAGWLVP